MIVLFLSLILEDVSPKSMEDLELEPDIRNLTDDCLWH